MSSRQLDVLDCYLSDRSQQFNNQSYHTNYVQENCKSKVVYGQENVGSINNYNYQLLVIINYLQLSTTCNYQLFAIINYLQLSNTCNYQILAIINYLQLSTTCNYQLLAIINYLQLSTNYLKLSTTCNYQLLVIIN